MHIVTLHEVPPPVISSAPDLVFINRKVRQALLIRNNLGTHILIVLSYDCSLPRFLPKGEKNNNNFYQFTKQLLSPLGMLGMSFPQPETFNHLVVVSISQWPRKHLCISSMILRLRADHPSYPQQCDFLFTHIQFMHVSFDQNLHYSLTTNGTFLNFGGLF